jgi:hypothetical protein
MPRNVRQVTVRLALKEKLPDNAKRTERQELRLAKLFNCQ